MAAGPRHQIHNRIRAVLIHSTRYAFQGPARLAHDAGVSRSAVCRLLSGECRPSFALMLAVTRALERDLGRRIDPRELVSLDGRYPTPSVCALCGCRGCLPDHAYGPDDRLLPAFRNVPPGMWSLFPDLLDPPADEDTS